MTISKKKRSYFQDFIFKCKRFFCRKLSEEKTASLKIAGIYIIMGFLWIYCTDFVVAYTSRNVLAFKFLGTVKGGFYVLCTAYILYCLICYYMKTVMRLKNEMLEKEKLSRIVLDSITNGIWEWNIKKKEIYYSENWKKTLGYESSEVASNTGIWRDLIHPEDLEEALRKIRACLEGEDLLYRAEYRMKSKSGEYRWIESRGRLVKDGNGNPEYIIGTHSDVTNHKKAIEALVESEDKFRTLFHNANDSIYMATIKPGEAPGRFVEVNNTMCDLLGYTHDELLNMNFMETRPAYLLQKMMEGGKEIYQNHHLTLETVQVTKGGNTIPSETSAHLFSIKGQDVILAITRDITERKRSEDQLKAIMQVNAKLLEETLQYERLKNDFFSNISHELKTPLTIIFSSIQLLNNYCERNSATVETQKVKKLTRTMKQNCYRLLRLMNNLIDITSIDSGDVKLGLVNKNIVGIVESVSMSVADYISDKEVEFIFDTDIEEKIMACDPDNIERILLNLLSNAIKFTKPGDRIEVEINDCGDWIRIIVRDSGIGIPEDMQAAIFEKFRQVDNLLTRRHEGSGIGLTLTKSLVELHGGNISVHSEYGKGSEFIVQLPAVLAVAKPEREQINLQAANRNDYIEKIHIEFSDIYSA